MQAGVLGPLAAFADRGGGQPGPAAASAGSSTAANHLALLAAASGALPPRYRRKIMVTCDGAGASHDLVAELDRLASRRGHQVT